jgi:predicted ferric reductase
MAIVILAIVVFSLAILHSLGVLPRFVFSWDLVWRIFIYILLLLGVLTVMVKTWSIVVVLAHLPQRWLVSPSADPVIDIVSTVVLALALYGVWRWKKWGLTSFLLALRSRSRCRYLCIGRCSGGSSENTAVQRICVQMFPAPSCGSLRSP